MSARERLIRQGYRFEWDSQGVNALGDDVCSLSLVDPSGKIALSEGMILSTESAKEIEEELAKLQLQRLSMPSYTANASRSSGLTARRTLSKRGFTFDWKRQGKGQRGDLFVVFLKDPEKKIVRAVGMIDPAEEVQEVEEGLAQDYLDDSRMKKNGRGWYRGTAAKSGDYVVLVERDRFRVHLVGGGGKHQDVTGPNKGYADAGSAMGCVRDDAIRRGNTRGVVYALQTSGDLEEIESVKNLI